MAQNKGNKHWPSSSNDLLIVIMTCVTAPLLAHMLDLLYGDANPWKSDRLVILYFAAVAGYIISAKCMRTLKASALYERGLKLGNSDAMQSLLWALPVLLVTFCYDYFLGVFITAAILFVAGIILYRDGEGACINVVALCGSGILAMVIAVMGQLLPYEWPATQWIAYFFRLFFAQMLVCLVFDFIAFLLNKRRKQGRGK